MGNNYFDNSAAKRSIQNKTDRYNYTTFASNQFLSDGTNCVQEIFSRTVENIELWQLNTCTNTKPKRHSKHN